MPVTEHTEESKTGSYAKQDVKEFKLILWNARKIKELTKSEMNRIYALYRGFKVYQLPLYIEGTQERAKDGGKEMKYKGWKDSDNPKDPNIKRLNKDSDYGRFEDWLR